jgi:Matrixin
VRRADGLLFLVAGGFGAFVVTQVLNQWKSATPEHLETVAYAEPKRARPEVVATASDDDRADVTSTVAAPGSTNLPAPTARDPEDIRSRINSATDTYMADMLVDLNGRLIRWPNHREQALRIWVQSGTDVRDWDLRYAHAAREAFADWASDDVPLRFDFVIDSATSDVHISWVERFPPADGMRVGATRRMTDANGWIVSADIVVAVHDSAGTMIRPWDLAGIVRHEAGHALGLGHSRDPHTKMFPTEMVHDISPADRATLRLLYELPPGAVK